MIAWMSLLTAYVFVNLAWPEGLVPLVPKAIVGVTLLTFFPGSAVLRLFVRERGDIWIHICYSLGISLTLQIGILAGLSHVLFSMGYERPLSEFNVLATMVVSNVLLMSLFVWRIHHFAREMNGFGQRIVMPNLRGFAAAVPIPILAIAGSVLSNLGLGNTVQILALLGVLLLTVSALFSEKPTTVMLGWWILCIGLAIAWLGPFSSNHMFASDMASEYGTFSRVIERESWGVSEEDPTPRSLINVLSVSLLPVGYHYSLGVSGEVTYKLIYPFILGFLPLSLFLAFRRLIGDKQSFLSAVFFVSFGSFFVLSISDARICIAELFFALVLIAVFGDMNLSRVSRSLLCIIFIVAMVTSYYAIAGLFVLSLLIAFLVNPIRKPSRTPISDLHVMVFAFVFFLFWYMYTEEGKMISALVSIGEDIYNNLFRGLFDSSARDPVMQIQLGIGGYPTVLYSLMVWLYRLTQFFVIVGSMLFIVKSFKHRSSRRTDWDFASLIIANLAFLFISIIQPYFVKVGITRLYQMTLVVLCPTFIVGGVWLFEQLKTLEIRPFRAVRFDSLRLVVILVLIPYFLFSSGLMAAVTNDHPVSIVLSGREMEESEDLVTRIRGMTLYIDSGEIAAADWLESFRDSEYVIYTDDIAAGTILAPYGNFIYGQDVKAVQYIGTLDGYLFLRDVTVSDGVYIQRNATFDFLVWEVLDFEDVREYLSDPCIIYSNGDAVLAFRD